MKHETERPSGKNGMLHYNQDFFNKIKSRYSLNQHYTTMDDYSAQSHSALPAWRKTFFGMFPFHLRFKDIMLAFLVSGYVVFNVRTL